LAFLFINDLEIVMRRRSFWVSCIVVFTIMVTGTGLFAAENAILQLSEAFRHAIEKVRPSVVSIGAEKDSITVEEQLEEWKSEDQNIQDLFKRFMPDIEEYRNQMIPKQGWQGSGVIISVSGEVLTNNHVVSNADELTVTLDDGREMGAKVIATDPESDLALIQLLGEGPFPFAELGDSRQSRVGDWVLAIGNPFGLNQSVSEGIISAVGRSSSEVKVGIAIGDYIQTTAAINPGNSGGPLINLDGEVIGINNSIQTAGIPANLGIGFAIPTEIIRVVIDNLERYGRVKRGAIGILLAMDPEAILESYKENAVNYGALIREVLPDMPAQRAGIEDGDLILQINGRKVKDQGDLVYIVSMLPVDSEIRVSLKRDGELFEKSLILTDRSIVKEAASALPKPQMVEKEQPEDQEKHVTDLGVEVQTLDAKTAERLGLDAALQGVVVTDVKKGSPAYRVAIQVDDVITELNDVSIASVEDFNNAMESIQEEMKTRQITERAVMMYIYRPGSRFHPKYVAPSIELR
jgi:serine protease Do